MSQAAEAGIYLDCFLAPLAPFLADAGVTDIYVNRPEEVWVETLGGDIERHVCRALGEAVLMRLARQIAARSSQGISREHPLLAASLPDGARVQVAAPPATRGGLVMAIRKHVSAGLSLADYFEKGAFSELRGGDAALRDRFDFRRVGAGDARAVLEDAVISRRNILISGGTSTGKTTFLTALLRQIPAKERLILIEDTPELEIAHENAVGLLAARSELSETAISAQDLLIAALRMRPDRIILGELRGKEAYTFLRTVNTGHPGSMTTIHADSPVRAIEQLALLVLQAGAQLRWEDVLHYVRSSVDVFVQLERIGGRRQVAEIMVRL